jgi:hypothetical protein
LLGVIMDGGTVVVEHVVVLADRDTYASYSGLTFECSR